MDNPVLVDVEDVVQLDVMMVDNDNKTYLAPLLRVQAKNVVI